MKAAFQFASLGTTRPPAYANVYVGPEQTTDLSLSCNNLNALFLRKKCMK
jgi:hypothetical protein